MGASARCCSVLPLGRGSLERPWFGAPFSFLVIMPKPDLTAIAKRELAVEIVQRKFSAGLAGLCDPHFLVKRYAEFLHRDDPIYVELLKGMDDEPLSKTFVSYWTIAQTLATKSR